MSFASRNMRAVTLSLAFAAAAPLCACTLIANFVDVYDPCANGGCLDATLDATPDVTIDVRADVVKDSGPPPVDAAGACKGKSNGFYCGNNGLPVAIPKEYLVECRDAGPILTYCTNGCLAFPSGIPDRCDPCANKGNGTYCGQSFWPGTENATFLFTCGAGTAIIQKNCGVAGCTTNMGAAACK